MSAVSRTDVLVVGAGPTGLLAALQAAERGLKVELIEEEWRGAGHSYALALHGRSLRLLDALGLADDAVAAGQPLERDERSTTAASDERDAAPRRARRPLPVRARAAAERPRVAARAAARRAWASRCGGATGSPRSRSAATTSWRAVQRLVKESAGYAVAHTEWAVDEDARDRGVVRDRRRRPPLARPASARPAVRGGGSLAGVRGRRVRERRGAGRRAARRARRDDDERALASAGRPGAVEPGARGARRGRRGPVQEPAHDAARRAVLPPGRRRPAIAALLAARAPWFGPPRDVGWSTEVRFERRLSPQFGRGRVWLAGDAAHLTGPAGMQSMNAGLRRGRRPREPHRAGPGRRAAARSSSRSTAATARRAGASSSGARAGSSPRRRHPPRRGAPGSCSPVFRPPATTCPRSSAQLGLSVSRA